MTSHTPPDPVLAPAAARRPLRLELSTSPGRSLVDGAWWPRSRDIDVELADLVDHFPGDVGTVYRALYSRRDWTSCPRIVATARRRIRTGAFPRDDTHLVVLSLSTRRSITLLVVPPGHAEGERCMSRAVDPLNRLTAAQILDSGVQGEGGDPETTDQWNDLGGNWWQGSQAPSFRTPPRAGGPRAVVDAAGTIDFQQWGDGFRGSGRSGRTWLITRALTGWRLEFTDPGDDTPTFAGVHGTVTAAKAEADVVHSTRRR